MQPNDPPPSPFGLIPLSDELAMHLEERGFELDAFGMISLPAKDGWVAILSMPEVTILDAQEVPGLHPEAPTACFAAAVHLDGHARTIEVRAPCDDTRSGALVLDRPPTWARNNAMLPLAELAPALRRLWATYVRREDHFGGLCATVGAPYTAERLAAEHENHDLNEKVDSLSAELADRLRAIARGSR